MDESKLFELIKAKNNFDNEKCILCNKIKLINGTCIYHFNNKDNNEKIKIIHSHIMTKILTLRGADMMEGEYNFLNRYYTNTHNEYLKNISIANDETNLLFMNTKKHKYIEQTNDDIIKILYDQNTTHFDKTYDLRYYYDKLMSMPTNFDHFCDQQKNMKEEDIIKLIKHDRISLEKDYISSIKNYIFDKINHKKPQKIETITRLRDGENTQLTYDILHQPAILKNLNNMLKEVKITKLKRNQLSALRYDNLLIINSQKNNKIIYPIVVELDGDSHKKDTNDILKDIFCFVNNILFCEQYFVL